jgi:hypoxanthine phosphoribosyltransferase
MSEPVPRLLISAARIRERVGELASEIAAAFPLEGSGAAPVAVLGVLNGAFVFVADLVRALPGPVECGFVLLSDGEPRFTLPVEGRRVLLVEDILDSGHTLQRLVPLLLSRGAREVRICVLLDKPSRRAVPVRADWIGFTVPDAWIVGYGLDDNGRFRDSPDIGTLDGDAGSRPPGAAPPGETARGGSFPRSA